MFGDPFEPAYLVLKLIRQKRVFFWFSKDEAMGMRFLLVALESTFYLLYMVSFDYYISLRRRTDVLNSTSLKRSRTLIYHSNSLQMPY